MYLPSIMNYINSRVRIEWRIFVLRAVHRITGEIGTAEGQRAQDKGKRHPLQCHALVFNTQNCGWELGISWFAVTELTFNVLVVILHCGTLCLWTPDGAAKLADVPFSHLQ